MCERLRTLTVLLEQVLRAEAERLVAAGATYISVDEPVFVRYPDKVLKWGIAALDRLVSGLNGAFTAVHICCSYPTCPHKANPTLYPKIAPLLAASAIDGISVEHANKAIDLATTLRPLNSAGKSIILGVIRVNEDVESVELIKERAREAMKYIAPEQLILGPDCGLVCIGREAAQAKLVNLTAAAAELNAEIAAEAHAEYMTAFAGYAPYVHSSRLGLIGLAQGAATPYGHSLFGSDAYAHQGFPYGRPGFAHPHPGFAHPHPGLAYAGPRARFPYAGQPLSSYRETPSWAR